jgi:hypothetical protein
MKTRIRPTTPTSQVAANMKVPVKGKKTKSSKVPLPKTKKTKNTPKKNVEIIETEEDIVSESSQDEDADHSVVKNPEEINEDDNYVHGEKVAISMQVVAAGKPTQTNSKSQPFRQLFLISNKQYCTFASPEEAKQFAAGIVAKQEGTNDDAQKIVRLMIFNCAGNQPLKTVKTGHWIRTSARVQIYKSNVSLSVDARRDTLCVSPNYISVAQYLQADDLRTELTLSQFV